MKIIEFMKAPMVKKSVVRFRINRYAQFDQ